MKIQVLGSGCAKCHQLYEMVTQIVKESELNCEVEYITDVQKILEMGVMESPVLAVNNKPIMTGFTPDKNRIKSALLKALQS